MTRPSVYFDVKELADATISNVGKKIYLSLPFGAGQPVHLANEFYRRAKEDPSIELRFLSGLTLEPPQPKTELEKRYWTPIIERLFKGIPYPEYIRDARANKLPQNVRITEYYIRAGAFLNVPAVQMDYCASNYTHIARDMAALGANVGAAQLSKQSVGGRLRYSISSNASASLDLIRLINEKRAKGEKVELIGSINENMPFMFGGSELEPEAADRVLDNPAYYHSIFGSLREAITTQEYMIGLYASALVRDGGTIQIGIGSIGDAIGYGLTMRRENNAQYVELLESVGAIDRFGREIKKSGGIDALEEGLYGSTEMMTYPFVRLMQRGIIRREVYDWLPLQKLVSAGLIPDAKVTRKTLELLLEEGTVHPRLRERDVEKLKEYGILRAEVEWQNGALNCGGEAFDADLGNSASLGRVAEKCLGDKLKKGVAIHGGFFMGPSSFYDDLRDMPEERRRKINMREISYVNQLYGQEELKRLQRKNGRFFNTSMMITAMGAAVSDGLDNGQLVSGVGGQYNFVSMAHALEDGRSSLMCRAVRTKDGTAISNVVWSYGHTTIPRHLRDVYITEYGIADVRGMPDRDVIAAMINICDSRFQESLLETAKRNGKIDKDYVIPDKHRNNYPQRLEDDLKAWRAKGLFADYPYGRDLSEEETMISEALTKLKKAAVKSEPEYAEEPAVTAEAARCLERMGLDSPKTPEDNAMRRTLLKGLAM